MSEKLYRFDPDTLTYTRVKKRYVISLKKIFIYVSGAGAIIGVALAFFALFVYQTPREVMLKNQLEQSRKQMARFNQQLNAAENNLEELRKRENLLYKRMLKKDLQPSLLASASHKEGRKMNRQDMNGYASATSKRLEGLQNAMEQQHRTISLLQKTYSRQKERLAHTPSIAPIAQSLLKYPPHGFGRRIDPVYGTPAFHEGMDFTAKRGTPVYATADGKVKASGYAPGGYGIKVIINHSHGYKTLYAHLSKTLVQKGQQIKRGQKIGLVGNTGKSVAPHLHYEVHKNDKVVNPVHYFYNDLGPKAFRELVANVKSSNISLD